MKTYFDAPAEVQEKIQALFAELHDICEPHNLPMIAAVGLKGDENSIALAMSARLSTERNSAPNSMIAACEIMKMGDVPDEVVEALIERNGDKNECTCAKCQARREISAKASITH